MIKEGVNKMKHLSRRDFVRITAGSAALLAVGAIGIKELIQASGEKTYTETRELLGTYITICVVDPDEAKAKAAAQDTFATIERLSSVFSRFDATSELYRLNDQGHLTGASSDLTSVLERVQAQVNEVGRVGMPEHGAHAALVVKLVLGGA
jgi:thiamine biosynthesis lipoprotein